jgi:hypothetical protein
MAFIPFMKSLVFTAFLFFCASCLLLAGTNPAAQQSLSVDSWRERAGGPGLAGFETRGFV